MNKAEFRAYSFKATQQPELRAGLERLLSITQEAGQVLLAALWSEDWLYKLGGNNIPAYKVVGEDKVVLAREGLVLYLPSRIRRGIAEQVGRTLRSQSLRLQCFEDVRAIALDVELAGHLNELTRQVDGTLRTLYNKQYRWGLIRQTLQLLRKWQFKFGLDISLVNYTDLVHPLLQTAILPYAGDDGAATGQTIQYKATTAKLTYTIKVPLKPLPLTKMDWGWLTETLRIPQKIRKRLKRALTPNPHQPELRFFTLKGGLQLPILQFSWEYEPVKARLSVTSARKDRVLAVDVGLVNLTTSVVGQAGSQITPPIFFKQLHPQLQKIERIYTLLAHLQGKLTRYPASLPGQTHRKVELTRLYAKLNRLRKTHLYAIVKELLQQATRYGCHWIVLEDLQRYTPPKGHYDLSRRLSNWMRGRLITTLKNKTALLGITVDLVPAYWTSSYCPRCGSKGLKVTTTTSITSNPSGRCFHCSSCGYRADRDYIGALNVYRVFLLPKQQRNTLPHAKPLFYRKWGPPPDRSGGIPVLF